MTRLPYPAAERLDLVERLHDRYDVADPYRWLEDPADPRTVAWSAAQADLAREHLDGLTGRDHLGRRLPELLATGYVGPPVHRGDRAFRVRREPGQEHAVLLVRDGDGTERVLLDPVAIDLTASTTLDAWQPDLDGRLLAYQLSSGGDEESLLRVLDVATGEPVDGPLPRTRYSPVAWLPGGAAYFHVRRLPPEEVPDGEGQYHRRVYLHRVGTDPADDVEVFGAGLEKTNYYGLHVSRDGRWLVVSASAGTAPRDDVWLADLTASSAEAPDLRPLQVGVDARLDARVLRDGRLWLHTDRDAPRGRLAVADPTDPHRWTEVVAEDPEAVLEEYALLDGEGGRPLLVVGRTRHALAELALHDRATGERVADVPLPGVGSLGGVTTHPDGGSRLWFGWTSFAEPSRVHLHDAATGTTVLESPSPGSTALPAVHVTQVPFSSMDGTTVRMFVVAPEATPTTPRPTVLYGYGGFDVSLQPAYTPSALAWVETGGVWVVANLRGGSEEGQEWHRAGMRGQKQNVFDDFAAAGQALVAGGWTTPAQLAVYGGSNGGLLVGATVTQRPGLCAAAVCSAPLLDMVRYEQFGLGATWNDEYGTAADTEELGWLLGYSPYHHVRAGADYPAVLFTVFDGDSRVDPLHGRKLCAALQAATSGDRPVLIRAEAEVGHGARAVSRTVGLSVDTLAFLAAHTGLAWPG